MRKSLMGSWLGVSHRGMGEKYSQGHRRRVTYRDRDDELTTKRPCLAKAMTHKMCLLGSLSSLQTDLNEWNLPHQPFSAELTLGSGLVSHNFLSFMGLVNLVSFLSLLVILLPDSWEFPSSFQEELFQFVGDRNAENSFFVHLKCN